MRCMLCGRSAGTSHCPSLACIILLVLSISMCTGAGRNAKHDRYPLLMKWIVLHHCSSGCLIQAGNANYLQKVLSNQTSNFQIIEEEEGQVRVEIIVQLGPLLAIKAGGTCAPEGASRTMVSLNDIRAELGPLRSANNPKACLPCRAWFIYFVSSDIPCGLLHWTDSRQLLSAMSHAVRNARDGACLQKPLFK